MAGREPNLKVNVTTDTRDVNKGLKEVKQDLKDLDKTGNQALASIGTALGVDTGKIGQMASAVRGLGERLTQTGNEGAKAFGSLLKSIGPVQAGIAGLGLAAAIAGFKALKAEADNFKSTIDGMNMSMATSAYISTYKQVLHDVNSDTGRQVAEAMNAWEKGFGRFKAQLGATFSTFMTSSTLGEFAESMKGLRQTFRDADEAATRNEARGRQLAEIQKEELQVRREVADIEVKIAEQRRILRDRSADATERTAAEAEVRRLITERMAKQTDIAQRLYEVTQSMTDEARSTYPEVEKCVSLYEQWQGRIAATENEMAGVDRYANSIAGSTSKAAEAAAKYREEVAKMAEMQQKWSGLGTVSTDGLSSLQGGVLTPSLNILPQRQDVEFFKETFQAYIGDWQLSIGIKPEEGAIIDFTDELEDGMVSMVSRTSEMMGNLIGTLASGGNAWGDFKDAALSSLGDMAIAVGKIAIKTGVGMLGIQAALKMDNPYVAIAAGAALVALGAAVKSSLSAVASGDYSAGGGGYSGDNYGGSSGSGYETRDVKVYVTGTLEADGDKLITVINNTNNRNYYTK